MDRDEAAEHIAEQKKVGGPAFPSRHFIESDGMTLRDYFAAKALPAAMTICWADIGYPPIEGLHNMQQNARLAYQLADAMLAERAK